MDLAGRGNLDLAPGAALVILESPQQLDPLGGVNARLLVFAACALVPTLAIVTTLASVREISNPVFSILALVVIIVACAYYVRATSPFRAPFSLGSHAIVCLLALLAVALDALGQAGSNTLVRDDWAPIAIAALSVTFGSYRPPWEILACGVVTAMGVAAIVFAGSASYTANVPPVLFAALASLPVLAAGLAAAAISRSLVLDLRAWRRDGSTPDDVDASEAGIVHESTVAHHRALAEQGALPFLQSIVDSSEITPADAAHARELSHELRALMILDDQQSWVTRLVTGVDDPHRLSDGMDPDQRGCLRAIVTHLESNSTATAPALRLSFTLESPGRIRRAGATVCCTLEFGIDSARNTRVQLGPFVAIARAVFTGTEIGFTGTHGTIHLRFAATGAALRPARSLRSRVDRDDPDRDSPLRHASVDS